MNESSSKDGCFSPVQMNGVKLADRPEIERLLFLSGYGSCEYNFVNLFIWSAPFRTKWIICRKGHLFLHLSAVDELLFPCTATDVTPEDLACISDNMRAASCTGAFAHVPPEYIAGHPDIEKYFVVEEMPSEFWEYVYSTEALAELHGSKLAKKKNLISQFMRKYENIEVKRIDANILPECLTLSEHWRGSHLNDERVEQEKQALACAVQNYTELGIDGLAIFADGAMKAFSMFSRINKESCTVHFEKAEPDAKGAAQMINHETAKYLLGKFKYINREQDLGIEGLRHAKMSYMPEYMLKNCLLTRKP